MAVKTITCSEFREILTGGEHVVVNVLAEEYYLQQHIPGTLNLPLADLKRRAGEVIPSLETPVVVYCASFTCNASDKAVESLQALGYRDVVDYAGGMTDWIEQGGAIESGEPLSATSGNISRVETAERSLMSRGLPGRSRVLHLIQNTSFSLLRGVWLTMVLLWGVIFWIIGLLHEPCLMVGGAPVPSDAGGLGTAAYFSFVTATSVGFGDVVAVGVGRVLAVIEGVAGLLLFGVMVSKLVSHRQEQLITEIHRSTFEQRLGRVRINLHMVLGEFQQLSAECDRATCDPSRMLPRLESTLMVFIGELRTVHELLYKPRQNPEEEVLEALLASLSAVLAEIKEVKSKLPPEAGTSSLLKKSLGIIRDISATICGECVPTEYAPELKTWMDRIQSISNRLT